MTAPGSGPGDGTQTHVAPVTRIGPAGVIRGAVLRALTVIVMAAAGLLVFGLLPGGRDAPAAVRGLRPLPIAPAVQYLHPHGPNRTPLRQLEAAGR